MENVPNLSKYNQNCASNAIVMIDDFARLPLYAVFIKFL